MTDGELETEKSNPIYFPPRRHEGHEEVTKKNEGRNKGSRGNWSEVGARGNDGDDSGSLVFPFQSFFFVTPSCPSCLRGEMERFNY
jgi:hypothetical protein